MIVLDATTKSLELVTAAAAAIDWSAHWLDYSGTAATPGSDDGAVSSATDTPIVAAPAADVQRQVQAITVRNKSASATQTVTVQLDVSGTERALTPPITLRAGESLMYEAGAGWRVYDANGVPKMRAANLMPAPSIRLPAGFATANASSTRSLTKGDAFAVYIGRAERALTAVGVRWNVTTAAGATVSWAEVAIATGAPVPGANASLTVVGYQDVASDITGTGVRTTDVQVSSGQSIQEGDDVWVILAHDGSGTTAVARAQSIADELEACMSATRTVRPSTAVGTAQTYTKAAASDLAPWVALL
jgi:biotin carboxyl carrier protein